MTESSKPVKNMTRKQIQIFFERLREQRPHPETELNYSNPFELLVAVTLSAQATDVSVNKATDKLFPVANTPQAIYNLGVEGLKGYIKTIGLYNSKAENVIKACKILIEKHNGVVPNNRADLEALPGVGRKTANVVLNTAFGQPTMAVDTHIFRLGNRTGLAVGKNVLEVEHRLVKVIPKEFILDSHHWLILHGRYCCIARKPKCHECVVSDVCNWPDRFEFGADRPSPKAITVKNLDL
ncbi:endonuclease III [Acinetobacter lanii]|nr:endonuclease III [Acinetobacter lanii]